MDYLHHASFGIGVLGVLVIVYGVASGMVRFLQSEFQAVRGRNVGEQRKRLRHVLGYYLLLGLEFLIAADIIDTLMKPSVQDLIVLSAIVLIRTVISYSLNSELRLEKEAAAAPSRRDLASEHQLADSTMPAAMEQAVMPLEQQPMQPRAVPVCAAP